MSGKKITGLDDNNSVLHRHFIDRLKSLLPPGLGLAEEVSDLLGISIDSAYRRIRGETSFSFEEIYHITKKYPFSLDDLMSNKSDSVTFTYTKLTDSGSNFLEYFGRLTGHLVALNKFHDKRIFYVAEEMPLFYSFISPKYADFKLFYWQRSVLNVPEYQKTSYEFGLVPKHLLDLAMSSYQEYLSIPTIEIWTDHTIHTGLRQITFYLESGVITKEQALELILEYRKSIEIIRGMAISGRKNISDQSETFVMYNCELVLGTNCIYTTMGETKFSFISFNTLNSLTTTNLQFGEEIENWLRNLERKSTLISGVAEKQRYQFFQGMFKKIDDTTEYIRNKVEL